ncbi:MAG: hypothetical protein AB7N76_17205 [Planctomycetota bacterium]
MAERAQSDRVRVRRRRAPSRRTCVYCRDTVLADERLSCESCAVSYHQDCWEALGSCATLGCRGRPSFPLQGPPLIWSMGEPTAPPAEDSGVLQDPPRVAWVIGLGAALLGGTVGFMGGGCLVPRHGFGLLPALIHGGKGVLWGGGAGAAYGFLQGAIGLRWPMPERHGLVTLFLAFGAMVLGAQLGSELLTVLLVVVALLVGGRFFGFNPGER